MDRLPQRAPGRGAARKRPQRPRGRASGDAGSSGEGAREAQLGEGGEAARRVLALGDLGSVSEFSDSDDKLLQLQKRRPAVHQVGLYIYIFFVSLGFLFFVFAKIAKF